MCSERCFKDASAPPEWQARMKDLAALLWQSLITTRELLKQVLSRYPQHLATTALICQAAGVGFPALACLLLKLQTLVASSSTPSAASCIVRHDPRSSFSLLLQIPDCSDSTKNASVGLGNSI